MPVRILIILLTAMFATGLGAAPVGSAFTYQGTLEQAGTTADGVFDFEVGLFLASGGTEIDTASATDRVVTDGVFTLNLDFTDAPFQDGEALLLELRVREGSSTGAFTPLLPRQPIRAVPYALHARTAASDGQPAFRPPYTETRFSIGSGRTPGDSSIVVGGDGLPFIAVHDVANGDLIAVHCEDVTCGTRTITRLDFVNLVGANPTAIIAPNGLPVIGYYDATNGDLRVAFCANAACTSATLLAADSPGDVGREPFAVYRLGGAPSFLYYDATNGNLKAIECRHDDQTCSPAVTLDASASDVGRGVSAGYSGSRLFVAYHNQTSGQLLLKTCLFSPTSCNGTPRIVDASADAGDTTAVVVPPDGLPLILYTRSGTVQAARCSNVTCTASVLTPGSIRQASRIAALIGADNTPHLLSIGATMTSLARDRCGDPDCSSVIEMQSTGYPGQTLDGRPSMTMGAHGFPYLAYRVSSNLEVATCASHDCGSLTRR